MENSSSKMYFCVVSFFIFLFFFFITVSLFLSLWVYLRACAHPNQCQTNNLFKLKNNNISLHEIPGKVQRWSLSFPWNWVVRKKQQQTLGYIFCLTSLSQGYFFRCKSLQATTKNVLSPKSQKDIFVLGKNRLLVVLQCSECSGQWKRESRYICSSGYGAATVCDACNIFLFFFFFSKLMSRGLFFRV